jgi:hypothetical protein
MHKFLFAGAVAGGFLLLAGAPAHAGVVPAPAGTQSNPGGLLSPLGGGLDPAGGLDLQRPLGGAPLLDVNPGGNAPIVDPDDVLPSAKAVQPADRMPKTGPAQRSLPPADVVPTTDDLPTDALSNLLGGQLGGGLPGGLPGGGQPSGGLLGGLPGGGQLPDSRIPADGPADVTGMPAGGTAIDPADRPADTSATGDPRPHQELIDNEATAGNGRRAFSDSGRPVAGTDPDYR